MDRRLGRRSKNGLVEKTKYIAVSDLRHAFAIDRYPIDGLLSGEFHVFGSYRMPFGYGTRLRGSSCS